LLIFGKNIEVEKLKSIEEIRGVGIPGLTAKLILRTEKKAIYLRSDGYYEIFQVHVRPPSLIFDHQYPEMELYPCNEDFGKIAWTCKSYDGALRIYESLN
jgi:hypothetical protein